MCVECWVCVAPYRGEKKRADEARKQQHRDVQVEHLLFEIVKAHALQSEMAVSCEQALQADPPLRVAADSWRALACYDTTLATSNCRWPAGCTAD